ncbi:MAG: hypothetical protein MJY58_06920 [Bacteroidaceae bacterium]|nr:hypothetical protein [Bacteroidaceae bacterium]
MKTYRLFTAFAVVLAVPSFAQTSFDASYLYRDELIGTARYVAMGGAMGALGSDASVISQNPAGIGTYHQSDFNATFSVMGSSSVTSPKLSVSYPATDGFYSYYSSNRKSALSCNADMLSIILSGSEGDDRYANFGFVYRRTSNSNCDLDYIDSFDDTEGYEIFREYREHRTVNNHAFDFNLSGNYENIVYLGATMEILSTEVTSDGYFYDYYNHGDDRFVSEDIWSLDHGVGFNMSFGAIVRPIPVLRLGASFKTPTRFGQSIDYEDNLFVMNNPDLNGDYCQDGTDYRFISPWSTSLSAGLTVGTTAFDIEFEKHYVSRAFLSTYDGKTWDMQGAPQYRNYSTFRMGMETNIRKFSLRCGMCHNGSMFADNARPYLTDNDFNDNRAQFQMVRPTTSNYLSCGAGYCSAPDSFGSQFYLDMALVHGVQNQVVCANESSLNNDDIAGVFSAPEPVVDYKYKSTKLMLTLGWSF